MKKKLGEIIIQIIPVMIGVYLGFLVSNWADNRKTDHQSQVLIESLTSELKTNKRKIENVVDYHVMLRDSARFYSQEESSTNMPRFFEGTRIMKLTNSAYDTGKQTGVINDLPLNKIQALNELYTYQKSYDELGKMILESFINLDFAEDPESMRKISRFIAITMTDVVIQENNLINGYDALCDLLEK